MLRVGLSRRTLVNRMVRQDFAYISDLKPAAWYRFGQGITVTGAGVSTWADQSGNGNDLLQGTDTNRPALQADGSILFDGADNYMVTADFGFAQPCTYYFLGKQITWTAGNRWSDGVGATCSILQNGISPQTRINAGSAVTGDGLVLNVYGVLAVVFNNTASLIQINNSTPTTGTAGTTNPLGFNLASAGGAGSFGNIQVKEVILFPTAHDATQRGMVIRYLARVGGLSV